MARLRLVLSLLILSSPLQGAVNSAGQLAHFNHFNSMQPAQSKGSLGLKAGVGYEEFEWSELPLVNHQVYHRLGENRGHLGMVNVSVHKGSPWPVDVGLSHSQVLGSDIIRWGAYVKGTLFEGFRLPSLAIQYGKSKMTGLQSTMIAGDQISLLLDYSISYFTLFYTVQVQRDTIRIGSNSKPALSFQESPGYSDTTITTGRNIGLIFRIWPGVADLSVIQQNLNQSHRYLLQFAFGL